MAQKPIHIKASRRGTFTAAATENGKSVQQEATAVLNDPNASKKMRRKAQFAKNAKKWHH
jgi:hypothetical protein